MANIVKLLYLQTLLSTIPLPMTCTMYETCSIYGPLCAPMWLGTTNIECTPPLWPGNVPNTILKGFGNSQNWINFDVPILDLWVTLHLELVVNNV